MIGKDLSPARLNSDGTLDTFDSDGRVTTDFYSSSTDRFNAVTIQGDKIVAAGSTDSGGGAAIVARYTASASLLSRRVCANRIGPVPLFLSMPLILSDIAVFLTSIDPIAGDLVCAQKPTNFFRG